jgi:hypothetical protein
MCPDLRHIHDVRAGYPEECINLLANELTSLMFTLFYDLPGYVDFLHTVDLEPAYRAHRRQLQLLQGDGPAPRWVLKAPFHLLGLKALLTVYPDATVVQTHRDPTEVVASEASLFASIRRAFHDGIDLHQLGRERLDALGIWLDRGLAARDAHGEHAFLDVHYRDLVADPLAWAERICAHVGEPVDEATRAHMAQHMAQHRQHKHGRHRYDLGTYGLHADEVRARFAPYLERFDP